MMMPLKIIADAGVSRLVFLQLFSSCPFCTDTILLEKIFLIFYNKKIENESKPTTPFKRRGHLEMAGYPFPVFTGQ
jgi:hypothetical protein